jgi:signal transduction histidine kinase
VPVTQAHHHERESPLHGDALRLIEREFQDLLMSTRALAALLRDDANQRPPSEHILVRMLESEINQIGILSGELCTALKLEDHGPRLRGVDLAETLVQAAQRLRMKVTLDVGEAVPVTADPEAVMQVVQSALALAVRLGEEGGRATVGARPSDDGGEIVVRVPGAPQSLAARRRDARMAALRSIAAMQGGKLIVQTVKDDLAVRVWFPSAMDALARRRVRV